MAFYEIPLGPSPRRMTVDLGGTTYILRFAYDGEADAGWFMDVLASSNTPLVCGIPLVTGCDLLGQYRYLGIPGQLYVTTDGDPSAVPTAANLGLQSHVYFRPFA